MIDTLFYEFLAIFFTQLDKNNRENFCKIKVNSQIEYQKMKKSVVILDEIFYGFLGRQNEAEIPITKNGSSFVSVIFREISSPSVEFLKVYLNFH